MFLDQDTLARVMKLELEAKKVVKGYLSGMHRSSQHGFAIEFAQHREYTPGDDIRHIDWKVFARKERFYLKQYDLETNLLCWFVVDCSDSMNYSSGKISKYDFASQAIAVLSYLVLHQGDRVGLARFSDRINDFLSPTGNQAKWRDLLKILSDALAQAPSKIGPCLHLLAERFQQRGLVMVFSDFFDDIEEILHGLKHLAFQGHEVVVFHILDRAEIEFPFYRSTLFHGLETPEEILTDPKGIRDSYLEAFNAFRAALEVKCRAMKIDYVMLVNDENLAQIIGSYLYQRDFRK